MKLYKLWKDMQNIIKGERSHNFKKSFPSFKFIKVYYKPVKWHAYYECLLFFTNISNTTIGRRQSEGGVKCDEKKSPGMINTFLLFWLCFQGLLYICLGAVANSSLLKISALEVMAGGKNILLVLITVSFIDLSSLLCSRLDR